MGKQKYKRGGKTKVIMAGFAVVALSVGVLVYQGVKNGTIRIGAPQMTDVVATNGSHLVSDFGLEPNEYAIYAIEGKGFVSFGGQLYELDSQTYREVQEKTSSAPFPMVLPGVLYQEHPKILISADDVIIVSGTDDFKIGFVKK